MEQFSGKDHIRSDIPGSLYEAAEMEAWTHVESFAEEARTEREREIEIKREHAERYFEEQIEEWEARLGSTNSGLNRVRICPRRLGTRNRSSKVCDENAKRNCPALRKRSTSRHRNQIL
jgi:hypothetical protein